MLSLLKGIANSAGCIILKTFNFRDNKGQAKNELLEIAYESQTTLMSAATTLHAQGEQIQDAARKMDMLHGDLQVAENIVSDMESWFGYWKINSSKDVVTRGQDFKILVAKSHQESHTPSKLILGAKSIDIYDTKDKVLHTFSPKDLSNTLVHSPYDITLVKRSFGKPDVKVHVIATKLPILLSSIEKIYKQKLILEDPPLFNGDDSDDYDDAPTNDDDTQEAVKDASDFYVVPNVTENRNKLLAGMLLKGGSLGGYAISYFRNFSALFPQICRQKLAISAVLEGYEQSLPTSYKTQHKPFSFHFAHYRSESSSCSHCG